MKNIVLIFLATLLLKDGEAPYKPVDNKSSVSFKVKTFGINVRSTKTLEEADLILASKLYFKENLKLQHLARENKIPVYIVNSNTVSQITNILKHLIEQKVLIG